MKLYTEQQLTEAIELARKKYAKDIILTTKGIMHQFTPIELPSDEEIEKQSDKIAHNYFDMHNTNHYQGLKEGAEKMGKWIKEQIQGGNK